MTNDPRPRSESEAPREPVHRVDYAWRRMDDPTNLMVINGVFFFDQPLEVERLATVLEERFLVVPRFRQRLVAGGGGRPRWEDDPDFRLDAHLHHDTLPDPGDDRVLQRVVSERMTVPLPPDRPLWEFHVLDGYRGGSAVLTRFHHCVGDGLALMMVLLSITDLDPDGAAGAGAGANPLAELFQGGGGSPEEAQERVRAIMPEGLKILNKPSEILRSLGAWKKGAGSLLGLGRLTFCLPDPRTVLKGPLSMEKRVVWSGSVPLEAVQQVRRGLGGTVNDVLLTAMTGGLRRYLLERGPSPRKLDFRAMVPVSLRPVEEMADMGNRFGLVLLKLPVGLAHPVERLEEMGRRMRSLTRSLEPWVAYKILAAMGMSPEFLQRFVMRFFTAKATAVMTNVPGPRETLYLAGRPIRGLMFWVPHAGALGMGISILSYAGEVRLGVDTDAALVPDPELIVEGFHSEFDEMLRLASG